MKRKGYYRHRNRKAFSYVTHEGIKVRSAKVASWIDSLAIPPAWEDVWICSNKNAHLLATGRDSKNRKQYRYNRHWRERQDSEKYARIIQFAKFLPKIRVQARRDIRGRGLTQRKVLAAVVLLLERTRIRVGNEEYAKKNSSYGLTTLQDRHVKISGKTVEFSFVGKSGKPHKIKLEDRSVAGIVKECRDLPGPDLFQYVNEEGNVCDVTSSDVNRYLRTITGKRYSAKDFRTWSGTVLAALALQEFEAFDSHARAKKNIREAIESVAKDLGNTPTICRNSYIHPVIVSSYLEGSLIEQLKNETGKRLKSSLKGLTPEEAAVLAFLEKRLSSESRNRRRKS